MNPKPSFNCSHKSSIQYRLHREICGVSRFSRFVLLWGSEEIESFFHFLYQRGFKKLHSLTREIVHLQEKWINIVLLTQLDKKSWESSFFILYIEQRTYMCIWIQPHSVIQTSDKVNIFAINQNFSFIYLRDGYAPDARWYLVFILYRKQRTRHMNS